MDRRLVKGLFGRRLLLSIHSIKNVRPNSEGPKNLLHFIERVLEQILPSSLATFDRGRTKRPPKSSHALMGAPKRVGRRVALAVAGMDPFLFFSSISTFVKMAPPPCGHLCHVAP